MKELSIEEKAQRYDGNYKSYMELINRLEGVKNAIEKQNYGIAMDILCKPYPEFQITTSTELKESGESEDEKIRKGLIEILSKYKYFYSKEIAWLEKQKGKEFPASEKRDFGYFSDPADKIEPKFKIGDFIANDYCFGKVIALTDDAYLLDTEQGIPFSCKHNVHLWTIRDAKLGDVLVHNGCTFIFMGIKDGIVQAFDERLLKDVNPVAFGRPAENNDYQPATKEERDLLFQKIKELGYEWDDEKKELKNVKAKFKAGDWVVNNRGHIWKIERLLNPFYYLLKGIEGDELHLKIAWVDKTSHLWTIQDAKDGDVLQLGKVTAIFKKYISDGNCKCYCSVCDEEFEIPSQDGADNIYGCYNAIPATKEQRDLLFTKMKEAGYEWDVEKKELRKIDWNPQPGDTFRKKGTESPIYHLCDKREDGINFGFVEERENGGEAGVTFARDSRYKEKKMDLEKEMDKEWNKCEPIDEGMGLEIASIEHEQFDNIAKYFFELGLKAQKGK